MIGRITAVLTSNSLFQYQSWVTIPVRTRMRYHFPRPNERKRVTQQGYFQRLLTLNGRKIIMRRILKGRHVLGH